MLLRLDTVLKAISALICSLSCGISCDSNDSNLPVSQYFCRFPCVVMMTVTPCVQYCTLPALPTICSISALVYSSYPLSAPLQQIVDFTTTNLAGRFTPIDSVLVVQMIFTCPAINSSSMILRSWQLREALWKAMPHGTMFFRDWWQSCFERETSKVICLSVVIMQSRGRVFRSIQQAETVPDWVWQKTRVGFWSLYFVMTSGSLLFRIRSKMKAFWCCLYPSTWRIIFTGLYSSPNTFVACFDTPNQAETSPIFGIVALAAIILTAGLSVLILVTTASRVAPRFSILSMWISSNNNRLNCIFASNLLVIESSFSGVATINCEVCIPWASQSRLSAVISLTLRFGKDWLHYYVFCWQRHFIGARQTLRNQGLSLCSFRMASQNKTVFPVDVGAETTIFSRVSIIKGRHSSCILLKDLKEKWFCIQGYLSILVYYQICALGWDAVVKASLRISRIQFATVNKLQLIEEIMESRSKSSLKKVKWRFTKKQPLGFGRAWYVVGNTEQLGSWDPSNALRLKWGQADNWSAQVLLPADKIVQYKYIEGGFEEISQNTRWEGGENRKLNLSEILPSRDQLKIMTFNIRYDNPADGVNCWDNRKQALCKELLREFPCVIGLQEAKPHQRAYIQQSLREYYSYIGIPRDLNNDEQVGLLYLTHKFFVIDSGFVWFNEGRKPGQVGFNCKLPRYMTYAILEDQQMSDKSLVINLHFDHESAEAHKASPEVVLETVDKIVSEDTKYRKKRIEGIYLIGDYNIPDNSPYLDVLYNCKYRFLSARKTATTGNPEESTFHGFKGKAWTPPLYLDHILYSSNRAVKSYRVLVGGPPYLSDHNPVEATFVKQPQ